MDEKVPFIQDKNTIQRQGAEERSFFSRVWRENCLPCIPARYMIAIVSCLGFVNVYGLRVNLSVAIVQMVNSTATIGVTNESHARTFDWTSTQRGQVLGSFFYGYILTQIPGGLLAEKIGGRWVFGIGIVMTAVLTLLTPLAASVSVWLLVAVRSLEGFFEGVTFPAMHSIWAKWAPPAERSRLATITYAGPHIGTVLSFPLSALLIQYGFDGGWPSVFYVFGIVGILWFFLWVLVGFSDPASHPRISAQERNYIETSIGEPERPPTPWLSIFSSPAVWAVIIAHFCNNWGFYTLLTCMPTFFKQALPELSINHGSIVLNGIFSAIPYTLLAILVPTSGIIADLLRKDILSTGTVRKIMTTIAFSAGAVFLLLCGYFGTTSLRAVSLLTIAVGFQGCALAGFNINHLDIAPRYSGVLMGITNTAATLPGFIGPTVATAIAHEPSSAKGTAAYWSTYRDEWREVFYISAEIYVFGIIMYCLLGSGRKQRWADGNGAEATKNRLSPPAPIRAGTMSPPLPSPSLNGDGTPSSPPPLTSQLPHNFQPSNGTDSGSHWPQSPPPGYQLAPEQEQ